MLRQFVLVTVFVIASVSLDALAQSICPENRSRTDTTLVGNTGFITVNKAGVLVNGHAFYPFGKETPVPPEEGVRNKLGAFGIGNYRIVTRTAVLDPNRPHQIVLIELIRRRNAGYVSSWFTTDLKNFSDGISFTQIVYQFNLKRSQAISVSYSISDPLLDDPSLLNDPFFLKKVDLLNALAIHPAFTVENLSDPNFMAREEMRYFRRILDDAGSAEFGYTNQDELKVYDCNN